MNLNQQIVNHQAYKSLTSLKVSMSFSISANLVCKAGGIFLTLGVNLLLPLWYYVIRQFNFMNIFSL